MPTSSNPPGEINNPTTFGSRGVALPFTSPLLAGARVRRSSRPGHELVVPSPSGSRGVYILQWLGVRALCNPTIHDTMLFRRISSLTEISPSTIREAALDVAVKGAAGREAASSAGSARARDNAQRVHAHLLLLMGLIDQVDPGGSKALVANAKPAPAQPLPQQTGDYDRRANRVLQRLASALDCPAAQLSDALVTIGNLFGPVGVSPPDRVARIPLVLNRLKEVRTDVSRWLSEHGDNDISGLGLAVALAMGRAHESGEAVLRKTRTMLADPATMLKRWVTDSEGVTALAARCDWLLDGWERVSLLWLCARNNASRRAALLEMATMAPVLPHEVMEWTDTPVKAEAMEQVCRVISRDDSWRIGSAAFALVERNEKLLAMST